MPVGSRPKKVMCRTPPGKYVIRKVSIVVTSCADLRA